MARHVHETWPPKGKGSDILKHSINKRTLVCGLAASAAVAGLLAVSGPGSAGIPVPTAPEEVYALTNTDRLLQFNGNEPNVIVDNQRITGLNGNESLVGIDFRPTVDPASDDPDNGQGALYGIGDKSNVYIIDEDSGAAEKVTKLQDADGNRIALEGNNFGVDFNPTVDRLRIVSNTEQNLRANVDTGLTLVDGDLNYVDENAGENPGVTAVAYRNSQPGAFGTTTELYDIDASLDILATQVDANGGDLDEDGPLTENVKMITGFDIETTGASPAGDEAYAALQRKDAKASGFFSVNLDTGEATMMGRINGPGTKVEGLAIPIAGDTNGGGTTMMEETTG